jgi:hypothetical protein
MYLRSTPRRNKDGTVVRYLQLAHNVWDLVAKRSKVQVIYNFAREDTSNREALQRLVASVTRSLHHTVFEALEPVSARDPRTLPETARRLAAVRPDAGRSPAGMLRESPPRAGIRG